MTTRVLGPIWNVAVWAAVSALTPKIRLAILLRYFEELSEKEMAQRLGIPKGTIKSRLHHALRKLAPAVMKEFS